MSRNILCCITLLTIGCSSAPFEESSEDIMEPDAMVGSNTGGNYGTEADSGGAGISNTGGEQNTGGQAQCTPKTCLTLGIEMSGNENAYACGVVEDGCGNYINCGTECEGFTAAFEPGTPMCNEETNLCEDRCTRTWEDSLCVAYGINNDGIARPWYYTCKPSETASEPSSDYPYPDDLSACTYVTGNSWCCIN